MLNMKRVPWQIIAVLMALMMTTMACGFSIEAPEIERPDIELPGAQPPVQQWPTAPSMDDREGQNGQEWDIPETGLEPGQLAGPVTEPPENLEELYERSSPGTVSILVEVNQNGMVGGGAGSGFVLTDNGYIVTNHHVIAGATNIVVRFFNDTDVPARVVGDDPNSDLAILLVQQLPEGTYPLPLGDSSQVRVGDAVVAIGNPFSLGTSMSYGIISAVGRTIPSGFTPFNIPEAIQTDAAINPGNSGGPLINMNGEVIGINAQIRTSGENGGNLGIGFAIPVNILKLIYPSLIENGSYRWPYLGVSTAVDVQGRIPTNLNAPRGATISEVTSGGPAQQAGLRAGDVVIQAGEQQIRSFDDLLTYVAYQKPGDQITLTVVRGNQQRQVTVTLGERPTELLPQQ
jgi:2-alkenal reductase